MTEAQIQAAVIQHLELRANRRTTLWFHPANGGKRNIVAAVQFKRMGVVPGVADLIIVHRGQAYALELKKEGGRTSESQIAFLEWWHDAGAKGRVVHGIDEALETLKEWSIL